MTLLVSMYSIKNKLGNHGMETYGLGDKLIFKHMFQCYVSLSIQNTDFDFDDVKS